MKILHVYKDYDPPVHGGMERHLALMCHFQQQWAHVEALVCSRQWRTRRREHEGVPITEVGEWGRFQSAPFAPTFPWRLRRINADIVVVHVPNPTAELGWLLARPKGKLIVRYQSDVVRQAAAMQVYGPFQRQFLSKAACILPSSQRYLETSATLQPLRERCRVLPLGILPEDFEQPDKSAVADLQARYSSPFVLYSGMHRYYKGLQYLVQAAPRVDAPIVIAGEGPERTACMALAEKLGVKIHFPGALSQQSLVNHLHACAVFAFPSCARSEAYGISMLEAHACGKPVVATTLGTGVEEVNQDGHTGLNVPPCDPEALAAALNTLIHNPEQRETLGRQAQQRVRNEFHAEHIAKKEFDLYQEIL